MSSSLRVVAIGKTIGPMSYPFYTIGHSTRPLEEFVDLLRSVDITLVADV